MDGRIKSGHDLLALGWRRLFEACRARAHEVAPGLADELARELDLIEQRWPKDLAIGTIHADQPPIVVITSNRTREIHDALKRRCFYYWVDYPTAARELEILERKAPGAGESLSREVVGFVQKLRGMDLFKLPGIAETIDWTEALMQLDVLELTPHAINDTLGVLLKYQDDIAKLHGSEAARLLEQVKVEAAAAAIV